MSDTFKAAAKMEALPTVCEVCVGGTAGHLNSQQTKYRLNLSEGSVQYSAENYAEQSAMYRLHTGSLPTGESRACVTRLDSGIDMAFTPSSTKRNDIRTSQSRKTGINVRVSYHIEE